MAWTLIEPLLIVILTRMVHMPRIIQYWKSVANLANNLISLKESGKKVQQNLICQATNFDVFGWKVPRMPLQSINSSVGCINIGVVYINNSAVCINDTVIYSLHRVVENFASAVGGLWERMKGILENTERGFEAGRKRPRRRLRGGFEEG